MLEYKVPKYWGIFVMNSKTRQLTEGAMIVAIISVIVLADRGMAGLLYAYIYWIMPLPMVVYATKYGFKASLIPVFCANAISFIYAYDLYMKACVLFGCIIGTAYGYGIKSKKPSNWLVVTTFVITLISEVVSTIGIPFILGYDLMEQITTMYEYYVETFGQYGYQFDNLFEIFKYVYIFSIILTAALETFLTHLVSHLILKRLRIPVEPLKKIGMIYLPKWAGYVLTAIIIFAGANNSFNWLPQYKDAIALLAGVAQIVFAFMGYYEFCFVGRLAKNKFIPFIALILFFTFPIVLVIAGMLFTLTEYRKKLLESIKEQQNGQV